ncbi:MAG: amino acid permease [Planctomycetota bacterium]
MNEYQDDLKKILGRWDSIAIIIAIVIGVGIFRVPAEVAKYLGYPNLIILVWVLGGIISLLGALCYAELSSSFPQTGGNYIYLRESYGHLSGFLFGWTELLVIRTGSIAAVSFIFAEYLQSFLSLDKCLIKPSAIFIVFIISFINIIGLRYGKRVQDVSTIAKIAALIGIIVLGVISKKGDVSHFYSPPITLNKEIFALLGLALIPILWTYGGWHENTFVAGETKNAKKTIPFALITGVFIITSFYVAINYIYIYLIPIREITNSNLIASDVLQILLGGNGKKLLEVMIIISSLGCLNAMIITGSRVTYAMAKDNIIFKYMGKPNTKYGTPHRAIIINAIWSIVLIIMGTFNELLFFTGILVWLFFALVVGGIFILRYKFPDIERPHKVLGYPVVPAIFIIICILLSINTIIFCPVQSLIGLGLAMTGIPVFFISRQKNRVL